MLENFALSRNCPRLDCKIRLILAKFVATSLEAKSLAGHLMSDNLYQPPKSDVDIPIEVHQPFYVVSSRKYWLMFLLTLGNYDYYWFYKNWRQQKNYHGIDVWPIARTIFMIFFVHSLFRAIRRANEGGSQGKNFRSDVFATLYVLLSLLGGAAGFIANFSTGSPYKNLISVLILPPIGAVLYRAQKFANIASGDPLGKTNDNFTAANIVWMLLGVLLWCTFLAGWFVVASDAPV